MRTVSMSCYGCSSFELRNIPTAVMRIPASTRNILCPSLCSSNPIRDILPIQSETQDRVANANEDVVLENVGDHTHDAERITLSTQKCGST